MRLPRLVALTPGDLADGRERAFRVALGRAFEAGLSGVLVREPRIADRALLELLEAIRSMMRGCEGAWLGVHDRPHIARLAGADACHLGFRSLPPDRVRACFGREFALGLSTHADGDRAGWAAADYLFHGPLFPTRSHAAPGRPGWRPPVGLDGLQRAVAACDRPILVLGGVRPADVAPALRAGAHGVAVLSGILGSEDPGHATARYLAALEADA